MWPFDKKDSNASPHEQIPDPFDQIGGVHQDPFGTSSNGLFWDPSKNGGIGGAGQVYIGNGSGGGAGGAMSPSQLQKMLSGLWPNSITKEEQEELARLKGEYEAERKAARLAEFKKLPAELRQFVMNSVAWSSAVASINAVDVPMSERHKELKSKEDVFKSYGTIHTQGGWSYPFSFGSMPLPEGLTLEDIKNAHIEQSLEEEMLNGKEET